jgi:GNAT superfamily N-acetyltransferase
MDSSMKVEKLSEDDYSEWQQLYRGYADFYHMAMDEKILTRVWEWIFDEEMEFYALSAKNDTGEMIGIMHYRQMPSPLRGLMVGFLDDLYVRPDCRGTGVVQALFESLNKEAKHNNWNYIRWITAKDNDRARAVYDKISEPIEFVTYHMSIK